MFIYLLKRLLHGIVSVLIVVAIVMLLVFTLLNKQSIFRGDSVFQKQKYNDKTVYMYSQWEKYSYLEYVNYTEYLLECETNGEIASSDRKKAAIIGRTADLDSEITATWVAKFTDYYQGKGYNVVRLDAIVDSFTGKLYSGGSAKLFAYKDRFVLIRLWDFVTNLVTIDNIHYVPSSDDIGERKITFTWFDPVYGGKFSPAIMGNGTKHKYLLYFDDKFPFIHQNLFTIKFGQSYSINKGVDIYETMTISQGNFDTKTVTYPTGVTTESSYDLHTATYISNSLNVTNSEIFTDNYTGVSSYKVGMSKIGYSFVIGLIATFISYFIGVPIGILMARKKDKLADKIGTFYIVFITAVPSLAYILMFKQLGGNVFHLPTTFDVDSKSPLMYILPVVSLALPSIAGLMRWLRRYMIDQMNSDYVKFARSGGLSESEIFRKHIFKNAAIPIVHGIPGSVLACLTGAIITERVYTVPGVGGVLTDAINAYDNGVIVGVAFFYAILSVVSLILGDILMALVDPRISFSTKGR